MINFGGSLKDNVLRSLLPVLDMCLQNDGVQGLLNLASQQTQGHSLDLWQQAMSGQQIAMETLTNIISCAEIGHEEQGNDTEDSDDESMDHTTTNMVPEDTVLTHIAGILPIPSLINKVRSFFPLLLLLRLSS